MEPDLHQPATSEPEHATEASIPVIAEQVEAGVRRVVTGGVRVHKRVREHEEVIDQPLSRERVDVRRVIRNEVVSGPLPVRQEGDTTIVPVVEEVLVVQRQWVLKEELHITKERFEERRQERIVVRREDPDVQRFDAEGNTSPLNVREATEAERAAAETATVDRAASERATGEASDPLLDAIRARRPKLVRKNKIIK